MTFPLEVAGLVLGEGGQSTKMYSGIGLAPCPQLPRYPCENGLHVNNKVRTEWAGSG